jgi:hypothetical protein
VVSYAFLTHLVSKHGIRKLLLLDILLVEDASVQEAYIEHLQVRKPTVFNICIVFLGRSHVILVMLKLRCSVLSRSFRSHLHAVEGQ